MMYRIMYKVWIPFVLALLVLSWAKGCEAKEPYSVIVDAIYRAEGGARSKYPFGILSVKCSGYEDCKRICTNTVRNNVRRWREWGHKSHPDYLEFLASRYAPVGAENDPLGLNQNWLRNVRYFIRRAGYDPSKLIQLDK